MTESASLTRIHEASDICRLWKEKRASLQLLCLRWTQGNYGEAEDLLGDAFLRAVEAERDNCTKIDNPQAWLATIICNLARDRLRTRRRTPLVGSLDPRIEPHEAREEAAFLARCTLATLQAALSTLTATQREALLARALGDNYDQIASSRHTSTSNARKLVELARKHLNPL